MSSMERLFEDDNLRIGDDDDDEYLQPEEDSTEESSDVEQEVGFPPHLELEQEDEEVATRGKLDIDDPRRMSLSREERQFALDIKAAVEQTPELDPISDFMAAQLSIICRGYMEDALHRVAGLQTFRQEYSIRDTMEDGSRSLRRMIQLFPRHMLSFSFSHLEGTYVLIHDITRLDIGVLTTQDKVDSWMSASYYLHTTMCPDFSTIRRGTIVLIECEGAQMSFKQNFKLIQDLGAQLLAVYPFSGEMRCFHTGLLLNLLASTLRKIMPAHLKQTITTGLTFDGRLDQYYLIPDEATANARIMVRFEETLKRRYENEATFRL